MFLKKGDVLFFVTGFCGKTKDRGSIDTGATKQCVMDILEGGPDAFERRKEMYSH